VSERAAASAMLFIYLGLCYVSSTRKRIQEGDGKLIPSKVRYNQALIQHVALRSPFTRELDRNRYLPTTESLPPLPRKDGNDHILARCRGRSILYPPSNAFSSTSAIVTHGTISNASLVAAGTSCSTSTTFRAGINTLRIPF